MKGKYFYLDWYRLIRSKGLLYGSLAVFASYIVLFYIGGNRLDIFYICWEISTISPSVILLSACTIPYAHAFASDMEHSFIRSNVVRGNIWLYVLSKVVMIVASSVWSMITGLFLFISLKSLQYPLSVGSMTDNSPLAYYANYDMFGQCLIEGHVVLYLLFSAAYWGLLGGIMGICSAYLSLYVRNKAFIIAVPMVLYYFQANYIKYWLKLPACFNLTNIFRSELGAFGSRGYSFFYGIGVTVLFMALFTVLIRSKIWREL